MEQNQKIQLFESMPIPKAVAQLSIPMVFSSLVMVLYNMADTYFVGMLNDPVQNAAVALAAPVLLAFNAVNNLFGVGTSSMMSRAMGRKDYNTVEESSAFGFYCALVSGIIFGILCTVFGSPLLTLIGADETTRAATQGYMFWTVSLGAAPGDRKCGHGISGPVGGRFTSCEYRNDERLYPQYYTGSHFYFALGIGYGGGRRRMRYFYFKLCGVSLFLRSAVCKKGENICLCEPEAVPL